jgi:hypothetical protein
MRLDRSSFLILTAALAVDACESQPPPAAPLAGVIDVPSASDSARAGALEASGPTATDASFASSGVDAAPTTAGNASADDTCAAVNSQGGTVDCSKLRAPPGPSCESFEDTRSECEDIKRVLRPAVAERADRCLLAKSGTRGICQFGISSVCVSQAFRVSCADPSTSSECGSIVRGCAGGSVSSAAPKLTTAECQGALSAVSPQNRSALLGCMSEGCTAGDCFPSLH